jgi:hypothetical protein
MLLTYIVERGKTKTIVKQELSFTSSFVLVDVIFQVLGEQGK